MRYDREVLLVVLSVSALVAYVHVIGAHPALPGGDAGELMAAIVHRVQVHPPGYPLWITCSHYLHAHVTWPIAMAIVTGHPDHREWLSSSSASSANMDGTSPPPPPAPTSAPSQFSSFNTTTEVHPWSSAAEAGQYVQSLHVAASGVYHVAAFTVLHLCSSDRGTLEETLN